MSIERERIEPAPFETAAPVEQSAPSGGTDSPASARWIPPTLLVLVLVALAVVFWLPTALQPSDNVADNGRAIAETTADTTVDITTGNAAPAPPGAPKGIAAAESPFAEAEAARLRAQAQEILEALLDLRDSLAERGAAEWATEALAGVNTAAGAGDELYRKREFKEAISRYREALKQAQAIEARIPGELESRLRATEVALQAGDIDAAAAELALVDKLEPGLEKAGSLRERLDALPEVLAQLAEAAVAEKNDDLVSARSALEAAVAADAKHRRAQQALQRVSAALKARRFADAMSSGYAALESQRFDAARAAFRRAGALREGSNEVATALQEVSVAETASELRRLQRTADANVEKEAWSAATSAYEAALNLDSSVLFAQRGLEQARARAELDTRLRAVLDDPDRLSDENVADNAARLLEYARSVKPRGPVLQEQISTLQKQLALSNTPVRVVLLSDNSTDVTLYKVSRLGTFEREELMLRPGEYTAAGTRRGYRDVRRTFRVSHEKRPPTLTIVCTESI